jgi:hypothetical protein
MEQEERRHMGGMGTARGFLCLLRIIINKKELEVGKVLGNEVFT